MAKFPYRYTASVGLGALVFVIYFWRLLPYSQRLRPEHTPNWWAVLILMLIAGFALTVGIKQGRYRVCGCLTLTLLALNMVMIIIDCIADPSNHNLLPFELAWIVLLTAPAYVGAAIASGFGRLGRR